MPADGRDWWLSCCNVQGQANLLRQSLVAYDKVVKAFLLQRAAQVHTDISQATQEIPPAPLWHGETVQEVHDDGLQGVGGKACAQQKAAEKLQTSQVDQHLLQPATHLRAVKDCQ